MNDHFMEEFSRQNIHKPEPLEFFFFSFLLTLLILTRKQRASKYKSNQKQIEVAWALYNLDENKYFVGTPNELR